MSRRWTAGVFALTGVFAGCCPRPAEAPPGRDVCVVRSPAPGSLPRLYRNAAISAPLPPASLLCEVPRDGRPLADRCDDDVDDLQALLGTARTCSASGVGAVAACPAYPAARLEQRSLETPPTCGGGCPDVEVAVREASGSVTRITFYDDPKCHQPEPACPGATTHACYYRVLSSTSELR